MAGRIAAVARWLPSGHGGRHRWLTATTTWWSWARVRRGWRPPAAPRSVAGGWRSGRQSARRRTDLARGRRQTASEALRWARAAERHGVEWIAGARVLRCTRTATPGGGDVRRRLARGLWPPDSGDRRARALPAVSRLDAAQRHRRGRIAGAGEIRPAHSGQAHRDRRQRTAAAGGGPLSARPRCGYPR